MDQRRYTLPRQAGKMLSLLPPYPGSLFFITGLNFALSQHLPLDVRHMLSDKKLRISVIDAQLNFDFQWKGKAFYACRENEKIDLLIGASAHDFLLLAQRKEDPDTLFFSRRLVMEGDTELGLLLKNTIDAIDFPVFELARLSPRYALLHFFQAVRNTAG